MGWISCPRNTGFNSKPFPVHTVRARNRQGCIRDLGGYACQHCHSDSKCFFTSSAQVTKAALQKPELADHVTDERFITTGIQHKSFSLANCHSYLQYQMQYSSTTDSGKETAFTACSTPWLYHNALLSTVTRNKINHSP